MVSARGRTRIAVMASSKRRLTIWDQRSVTPEMITPTPISVARKIDAMRRVPVTDPTVAMATPMTQTVLLH